MGVTVWQLRDQPLSALEAVVPPQADAGSGAGNTSAPAPATAKAGALPGVETNALDWSGLQQAVAVCEACGLHETRTNTVFGAGSPQARLMVIGEAPGAEEDRQGLPFVGRAGQLLTEMLLAIGFDRGEVFIANTLKCRPPNNRDPRPEEVESCWPYLQRQVDLIRPEVILAVGRIAAHNILKTEESLGRLRGKPHQFGTTGIPVYVTYHPAYLLRSPKDKAKAWHDLQQVLGRLQAGKSA